MRLTLKTLFLAAALPLAFPACGDDGQASTDAGVMGNDQLSVLNPPGDSIGLDFSESVTLRVQLFDAEGLTISGRLIEFSLLQTGDESAGASSLSNASAVTNGVGIAEVDLLAGAERVNFRVQATAPNAASVLFYIQVSDQGFSDVSIISAHEGPRAPESYDRVELRIYDDRDADCADIDFQTPPESLFPPRTQDALGEVSQFRNLAIGLGYTVIAWAEAGPRATPQATGCLHIAEDRLRSGNAFQATLPVVDSPYQLGGALALQTEIQLPALAATLTGAETWAGLACPLGRAQLLLDCLPDIQNPDATMDCAAETPGTLLDALEAQRGPVDVDGCRPATLGTGEASLDAELDAALTGWPSTEELEALLGGRDSVLGTLRIHSELDAVGASLARHRLLRAQIEDFEVNLVDSNRPVIEASAISMALSASPSLELAPHSFTLRYGQIASEAFEALALAPANVNMLGDSLGTEFVSGLSIATTTGCTALETFVCSELSLPASCANQCSQMAAPLSVHLSTWLDEIQSAGLDYQVAIQAEVTDQNSNLVIDGVSAAGDGVSVELSTTVQTIALPATVTGDQAP